MAAVLEGALRPQQGLLPRDSLLDYHLTCVELLSSCCKGKVPATKIVVRNMLSPQQVLQAVLYPDLCWQELPLQAGSGVKAMESF